MYVYCAEAVATLVYFGQFFTRHFKNEEGLMQQSLLTTRQAADYLGVSKAFLERDRWAGARIPFIRIGTRAVRYRLDDLNIYIADHLRHSTSDRGGSS